MKKITKRAMFWAPRIISMALILFLSLFALDVFNDRLGFWQTAVALLMHLLFPVFFLIAILIMAWHWEWIGAVLYAAAGLLYVWTVTASHTLSPLVRLGRIAIISGPAFVISALFLYNWVKRSELRS
jgi:hypothetical protein